ncbi:curli production assembly/transport protein CsgE [Metapseudomonas resinovorans]|uniref:Curli production assembly/transport component CsgE n=1 Tax=Metapseudomonas resinovorans NBRC 106553 TaxID=1245471 RepID=S6AWI1_METRE|nr:curli production assembly/transport protein CsgE [Pseudomonas resinovorans]BAN50718.1 putative curli production assembly/transport component CsgE [Pseudomonas resinovorans NBRC 106553]
MSRALLAVVALCCALGSHARAGEDEIMGFIVDSTISHIGREFYRSFSDRLRDTSKLDFNLVVRERPDARWGSLVWVEYERNVVYRQFLRPNTSQLQDEARAAADLVLEAIAQQKLQRLLQDTHDLERDEI